MQIVRTLDSKVLIQNDYLVPSYKDPLSGLFKEIIQRSS